MRLSKNFLLSEFTLSAGIRIEPTDLQMFCLKVLTKNILQPIRNKFGSMTITSGLRNEKSYKALLAQGYPASKSSDHFAWSDVNPKGTGASDIFVNHDMKVVFDWTIDHLYELTGQIIYYPEKNFIHVSNAFDQIFQMSDSREQINRVLVRRDGSFTPYVRRAMLGPKPPKVRDLFFRFFRR